MSRRTRWVAIPLIMIAVASIQVYRVAAFQLTPWKGGGFGMFSTTDSGLDRKIILEIEVAGLHHFALLPTGLPDPELHKAVRYLPGLYLPALAQRCQDLAFSTPQIEAMQPFSLAAGNQEIEAAMKTVASECVSPLMTARTIRAAYRNEFGQAQIIVLQDSPLRRDSLCARVLAVSVYAPVMDASSCTIRFRCVARIDAPQEKA